MPIKDLFLKNFLLKLLALLSALVFWFFIVGLQNIPQSFEEPLDIQTFNLPEELVVVGTLPKAEIKIITDKVTRRSLKAHDFDAYVDVKNANPGSIASSVYVTSKNSKVSIVKISPETVTVQIQEKFEKDIPVTIKVKGNPKNGYAVTSAFSIPGVVTIRGAESRLNEIHETAITVQLTGNENAPFRTTITPLWDGAGKALSDVEIQPSEVEVNVEVRADEKKETEVNESPNTANP